MKHYITKAAANRLLPRATRIESVTVMPNGAVQVTYYIFKHRCSTFISSDDFFVDFHAFRVNGSRDVSVKPWSKSTYANHYECQTGDKGNYHTVKVLAGKLICSCEDYTHQLKTTKKPVCKHAIAVFNYRNLQNSLLCAK